MHPEDIKAEIRKRGYTLRDLATDFGCKPPLVTKAIRLPVSERIDQKLSDFLGIPAATLWPDRYDKRGRRIRQSSVKTDRIAA